MPQLDPASRTGRTQKQALDVLICAGPSTTQQIAAEAGLTSDQAYHALGRLEHRGHVVRAGHRSLTRTSGAPTGGRAVIWAVPTDIEEESGHGTS